MTFTPRTDWRDFKAGGTPIKAADMLRLENGIADAHTASEAAASAAAAAASSADFLQSLAANPDQLAAGTITYSPTGAPIGFAVQWPDGATGAFTGTESATFPGIIDAYTVTHVLAGVTTTYTQAAVTRDATSGAVTNRPALERS